MEYKILKRSLLLTVLFSIVESGPTGSLVTSTVSSKIKEITFEEAPSTETSIPEIYEMNVATNVTNRYAKTLITSKVRNSKSKAQEAVFFVVLPEKAFISEFVMEVGGKTYKAYVKEKEEAKNIYDKAVSSGQSAAHVAVSARDSNKFTVSLNIEPESKAVFKLTYEELLQRQKGRYEIVLNIHPGQIVPKLDVQVLIAESAPLAFVRTPSLRSGNEISKNGDDLKPNTEITTINSTSSVVKFHPSEQEQKKFAKALDTEESEGFKGQFVVEYDVERNATGGEVLLNDGYFVHFLAPESLEVLPKQVVFVLDISGSMSGPKMQQLIDAMINILNDLRPKDTFSIVAFDTQVHVWDKNIQNFMDLNEIADSADYGNLEKLLREKELPEPIAATPENIAEAKNFVNTIGANSLTNIIGGLEVGLFIAKKAQEKTSEFHQPMIIFLTDGQANVGISNSDALINTVSKLNPKEKQTPIYSLSFGSGADKTFLRKLSSQNLGFSRHIYVAGDASLQLQDFYQQISSPSLKDIKFKYTQNATLTTKDRFPIFFCGSEIVVAGKLPIDPKNEYIVEGWRPGGSIDLKPRIIEPVDSLERLWAFLTVRQILDERDVADKKTDLTKKAVDLALKYSFVTPVTSMVVVKPNDTSAVDTENASSKSATDSGFYPLMAGSYPRFGGGGGGPYRTYAMSAPTSYNTGGYSAYIPRPSYRLTTTPAPPVIVITDTPVVLPVPIPQLQNQEWFKSIMVDSSTIKVVQDYKLALNNTVVSKTPCAKTVSDKAGKCTLIHECPKAISFLTDLSAFLRFFCPLEGFAGICCDE